MTVQTIDDAIAEMDNIIAYARQQPSRVGFFAALYRKMTLAVQAGIAANRFQDGARMERFDVNFANLYLTAWNQFQCGQRPSRSWQVAFEMAANNDLLILQHLLLGMNAHINLDLGTAAAQTCPGAEYLPLQHDFDGINTILSTLFDQVRHDIEAVSPMIHLLDQVTSELSEKALFNLSIDTARNLAWNTGQRLATLSPDQQASEIARQDEVVAALAYEVCSPEVLFHPAVQIIRSCESNDISRIIDLLCSP